MIAFLLYGDFRYFLECLLFLFPSTLHRFREIKNGSCRSVRTKVATLLSLSCRDQIFLGKLDHFIHHVCNVMDSNLVNTIGPAGSDDLLRVYYGRIGVTPDTELTNLTEQRSRPLKQRVEQLDVSTRLALHDAILFIRTAFAEIKIQDLAHFVPVFRERRPQRSLDDWICLLDSFLERV